MSSIQIFHVTLEIWGAIICAIATICAMNGAKVETRVSHRTAMITANTMVLMIADCLAWAYRGVVSPSAILITRVSNFMVFTCNYLMILLFFFYVQALLREKGTEVNKTLVWVVYGIFLISEGLLILSQFADLFYYFDEYNRYTRAPYFILSQVPAVIGMMILLGVLLTYRRVLSNIELLTILSYLVLPTIAIPLQAVFYGYSLQALATAVSVCLLFATTMTTRSRRMVEAMSEAERANHAKDDFLASMSHEIRTPINGILGMNEMILRESTDDRITEYANGISSSGSVLLSLVNEILDFSKISSGKLNLLPIEYELRGMLDSLVNMISPRTVAKALKFQVRVFPGTPNFLVGDEVRVRQVIANLLSNAVKYTQEGSITLDVNYERGTGKRITLLVSVEDTGIGIHKEDLPKLFSTFQRLEETRNRNIEGTGLGLAITQQLVRLMKGKITAESVYGKGSKFSVAIPQMISRDGRVGEYQNEGEAQRLSSEGEYHENFQAPTARILVVDDNNMNLKVAQLLLKKTKAQLTLSTGGRESLDILRKEKFDIILLDHMMPEMDGVEALRVMKSEHLADGTPVIALTANAVEGARQMYLSYGFDDYLSKPIVGKALEECLQKWLPEEKVVKFTEINQKSEETKKW